MKRLHAPVFVLLVVMAAPTALDAAAPAPAFAQEDAWALAQEDAWVFAQEDAWVFAQEDAWVFAQEDAWVFAQEDAWVFAQEDAPQPAVVVSEASGEAEEQPWTFRFLVPTVVAIAVLAVGATLAAYAFRVRGRYRVVR